MALARASQRAQLRAAVQQSRARSVDAAGVTESGPGARPGRQRDRNAVEAIPATFRTVALEGEGRIENVSRQGLFVRSAALPEPGEEVRLRFAFAGKTIEARGEVRWTTRQLRAGDSVAPGFGVHLILPDRDYLAFLQELCEP
jgi:PilZ domain-containing protein